jgi:hypothetical protein
MHVSDIVSNAKLPQLHGCQKLARQILGCTSNLTVVEALVSGDLLDKARLCRTFKNLLNAVRSCFAAASGQWPSAG